MSSSDEFLLPEEAFEWVGLKKSEYLSKLIENQRPGDFGFEDFHLFDEYIESTVQAPDKAFEKSDEDFPIMTYTRTYSDKQLFHHIVIGGLFPDEAKKSQVFVPILTFVTKMDELAQIFSVGTVKKRPTLN